MALAFIKNNKNIEKLGSWILSMLKPHRSRLILAMVCMAIVSALTGVVAYLLKPVVDEIFIQKNIQRLLLMPLVVVGALSFKGAAYFCQAYQMNYVGLSIVRRLRDDMYNHLQRLSLAFFQRQSTGVLMARLMNDVNVVKGMVSDAVTGGIKDLFMIVALLCVIFYQDWKLALIAILVLPLATVPIVRFGRKSRLWSTRCQEVTAKLFTHLHETITGIRIVKAFCMESQESKRFVDMTENLFNAEMKSLNVRAMSSPVMELLGGIGLSLVLLYGGYMVISGSSTPGTFVSFMGAVIMLYDPLRRLSPLNNTIQEGLSAGVRIFEILESRPDVEEKRGAIDLASGPACVEFKNVSFRYEDQMILNDIDLCVGTGEVLALAGMSGGGKSTLVNLVPRFYDVAKGAVLINGCDIRDLTISSLRRHIAIVTQDPLLFNDTIRGNIAYGTQNATEEQIVAAAKAAYAYDFINRFPDGFQTIVGEKGTRLSGGEKQRICIARALLKDAPILILDEATSALDTESEQAVQKALENLMRGRTTLVIAHRLSTIRNAGRIVVLVNGRIVEQGTHEELLVFKGEYNKLYEMQFKTHDEIHACNNVHNA